jgi:hypothetical protein
MQGKTPILTIAVLITAAISATLALTAHLVQAVEVRIFPCSPGFEDQHHQEESHNPVCNGPIPPP